MALDSLLDAALEESAGETNMATPIRVLVADDYAGVVRGLVRLLEAEPDFEVAGTAANGEQAVLLAAYQKPDVVVLDVKMPILNGIEAGRAMLDTLPRVKLPHELPATGEQA